MAEDNENIGMWSMYGQPWCDGIIVAIPSIYVKHWINSIEHYFTVKSHKKTFIPEDRISLKGSELRISAIAYYNASANKKGSTKNEELLTWSNTENHRIHDVSHISELTGYIKDSAWSYEKEVRVRLDIENKTDEDRVGIPIIDGIFNRIKIVPSPFFKHNNDDFIYKETGRRFDIKPSLFTDKLKISIRCKECPSDKQNRCMIGQ